MFVYSNHAYNKFLQECGPQPIFPSVSSTIHVRTRGEEMGYIRMVLEQVRKIEQIILIFVVNRKQWLSVFEGELCEASNGSKHFLVKQNVMAVSRLEDVPPLEATIARFVPRLYPGSHCAAVVGRAFCLGEAVFIPLVRFHPLPRPEVPFQGHSEDHVVVVLARLEGTMPPADVAGQDVDANFISQSRVLELVGIE